MPRFSERIGKRAPKEVIQVDTMDADLRNGLWNVAYSFIFAEAEHQNFILSRTSYEEFANAVWHEHLKAKLNTIPDSSREFTRELEQYFFNWDAYGVYDFIEFVASFRGEYDAYDVDEFVEAANRVLAREFSAYRFINGLLTPIVSQAEIASVEQAIQSNSTGSYKGASIHLAAALEKLSDRREPDYRNSIKESISAVESVCQAITGDPKATLGPALKKIEQRMPLHGALKEGLLKIYGYTSDSDGIRHALQDEPNLNQEDALFMLVTCSAFVNYLTVKADKAGN